MNRFEYIKKIYSVKWVDARKAYGTTEHEKFLISLVEDLCPKGNFLDVAIGTGEPFAARFISSGSSVQGFDISENLADICTDKGVKVKLGNAEDGLPYDDNSFDLVYCFNSTWYFKNIEKVINEMIRVSRRHIVFDIMDADNPLVKRNHLIGRIKHPFRPKYEFSVTKEEIRKLGNFREFKSEKPVFVFEKTEKV